MTLAAQIETIAAPATPPGKGGVAIIRISGPLVPTIIQSVLHRSLNPRIATHSLFYGSDHEAIDAGLAVYFPAPHSFTGEDVLEFHAHGGPVIVDAILETLLKLNVRLARPGEFSERAYLNNKIDLTQAEAIADLIDSSSKQAAKLALRSLQGEFAKKITALSEQIIKLRMYIEAAIDFAEEEIDFLADEKIKEWCEDLINHLEILQKQSIQGSKLREATKVVIVGEPNVGKSSLLNCLSAQEIAIVTNIPGTTRDVIRNQILIDGFPLQIVDTAGLRETDDQVEQEGVKRARQEMQHADLILLMKDINNVNATFPEVDATAAAHHIFIVNKIDLTDTPAGIQNCNDKNIVYISVQTGAGVSELKQHIKQTLGLCEQTEGIYLARRRHLDAIERAHLSLKNCLANLLQNKHGELAAEELRLAQKSLGEITGEVSADELLGRIFANFCVGK